MGNANWQPTPKHCKSWLFFGSWCETTLLMRQQPMVFLPIKVSDRILSQFCKSLIVMAMNSIKSTDTKDQSIAANVSFLYLAYSFGQ